MANTSSVVGKVVAPGDAVFALPEEGAVRIGQGLRATESHIVAQKCGVVRQTRKQQLWLEGRQKRYIPSEEDVVVGIVVDSQALDFRVDIGAPFWALLPQLSFEGATKKNKPAVAVGELVYARVVTAYRDAEPVLACVDAQGRAAGFGPLKAQEGKAGNTFTVSSSYARALLQSPPHPLLAALGKALRFEVVVGLNGRVWVEADSCRDVVKVMLALQEGEYVPEGEARGWVQKTLEELSAQMAPTD